MVISLPLPAGVTFPPLDIKNIIDKTSEFVHRGGAAFEATIIQKGKDNPTFGFIKPGHPFHLYYKHKLQELSAASAPQAAAPAPSAEDKSVSAAPTTAKAQAPKPVVKPKKVEPPPPLDFYLDLPPEITAQELDIMRLTAQFVARNGQQFHHGLLNRENRNPQFDFLKHNHPLNIIFAALVSCYSKVLLPPRDTIEKLKAPVYREKSMILEKAVSHMEWELQQERARKRAEEEEDQERTAMALIDWHDFVVVETIEFFDDESDLPAPASYEQLIAGLVPVAAVPEEARAVEEEMETDEMEMEEELIEEKPVKVEEPAPSPADVQEPPSPPRSPEPEVAPLPPPDTKLKILKEPIKPRGEPKKQDMMMLCPRCNAYVPSHEFSEHMRIELLDPKYSMQRKRDDERRKLNHMPPNSDVSKNLKNLSVRRTDIFGLEETEIGKTLGEEDTVAAEKVTWDGHSNSIGRTTSAAMAGITINDQINAIHANKGAAGAAEDKPSIGPQASLHSGQGLVPPRQPIITVVGGSTPSMPRPIIAPAVPALPMQPPMMGHHPMMHPGMGMMPPPYGMHPGMMPPGMYMGGMMPPGMHPPPPPDDEPNSKRQKTDELNLIPEEKFLADYPMDVNFIIQVPTSGENLQGQQLQFVMPPTSTITQVKDKIKESLGLAINKQKLKGPHSSILKDNLTLAYYNVTPGTTLILGTKERGGKKK